MIQLIKTLVLARREFIIYCAEVVIGPHEAWVRTRPGLSGLSVTGKSHWFELATVTREFLQPISNNKDIALYVTLIWSSCQMCRANILRVKM